MIFTVAISIKLIFSIFLEIFRIQQILSSILKIIFAKKTKIDCTTT